MADQKLKDLKGTGRRDFLRWSATAAACMGLERARLLNVINDVGGSALADTAACASTNRSFHVEDGNGGFSSWTLAMPHVLQGTSTDANIAFYAPGTATPAAGYANPWVYAKNSPNQDGKWKWTGFVSGTNETHTSTPNSTVNLGTNSMLASIAAVQQANPTLLPVLTVGQITFGTAPGAPAAASVAAAANLIDLFNSAASRALLQTPVNGGLADEYFKAFSGLNAAAGRSTFAKQYGVGKVSMNLLSRNLAAALTPSAAEEQIFGIDSGMPGQLQNIARTFIISFKAMALGLTSMAAVSGLRDDPHGMFAAGLAAADTRSAYIKKVLDGAYTFASSLQDPSCSAKTIADALVLTVSGDTTKNFAQSSGWSDSTPMGSNVLYVMGGGFTKTGWFGKVIDAKTAQGFDPATGALTASYTNGAQLGQEAAAAALYAVARGDGRTAANFFPGGAGAGVVNVSLTG